MNNRRLQLYLLAWGCYITASMLAYPYLRITVMQFSIPLAMLGGWLYSYRGALLTSALTVPYHYLLLTVHSDDPDVIIEALNPFGIGSLLLFSLGTALLQSIQQRYNKLNSELEQIVEERTSDLRKLNDHLINMQYIDRSVITSGLLDSPIQLLDEMLETSSRLCAYLHKSNREELGTAKIVHQQIRHCMRDLSEFLEEAQANTNSGKTLRDKVQKLSENMMRLSGAGLKIALNGDWNRLENKVTHELYNIISEAVTNAVRHAQPGEILIEYRYDSLSSTICVENDGAPFPDHPPEGMGLPLMRHRAMSLGGTLTIEGGAGQRTRITCTVPHTPTDDEKAFPAKSQMINTTA
jgi:signal transduction histidine kinase